MKRISILLNLSFVFFVSNVGCEQNLDFSSSRKTRTFNFKKYATKIKVDILFVVDTSGSMSDDHVILGQGFQNFTAYISELNYRIGFISADQYTASLRQVGQNNERYINPSMFSREYLFQQAMESYSAGTEMAESNLLQLFNWLYKRVKIKTMIFLELTLN